MQIKAGARHHVTHGHHDVHWLHTDRLTLGVVPALGGRLLSAQLDGHELLWRNPSLLTDDLQPVSGHVPAPAGGTLGDWHNYGGDKTWPAPQGWASAQEWAGPPDPVLDSGQYEAEPTDLPSGAMQLTLTSGSDPNTGLRISRQITVADDLGFELRLSAVNTSDETVTWALWNVTQLAAGGTVEVAVDDRFDEPVELVLGTGVPRWERTTQDLVRVGPQDVVGKLGFPHATGDLTYHQGPVTMVWQWEVDDSAVYPDGGSRAEVWMEHPQPAPLAELDGLDPPGWIVECEVLSPMRTLHPGESVVLNVAVSITKRPSQQEMR